MRSAIVCAFAAAILGVCGLFGQTSTQPLTFEVASVKPSPPDARGMSLQIMPGGGLRVSNGTLRMLLTFAYDVRDFQLSGGPGWIGSEHYDIVARPDRSAAPEEGPVDMRKMSDG